MQITLLHQVTADTLAIAIGEQNIVRQNDRRTRLPCLIQTAIDVLQKNLAVYCWWGK